MALTRLAGIIEACFADNVFYYKVHNDDFTIGHSVIWGISFSDYGGTTYKALTLRSVIDNNKETFVDISDVVQAEVAARQLSAPQYVGHEENYIKFNLALNTSAGTYTIVANVSVFWGKLGRTLKHRPYINGLKSYKDLFIDGNGKGNPAQASSTSYMYRGGKKYISLYFPTSVFQARASFNVYMYFYKGATLVRGVILLTVYGSEFSYTDTISMVYAEVDDFDPSLDYDYIQVQGVDGSFPVTNAVTLYPKSLKLPSHSKQFVWKNARGGYSSLQTAGAHTCVDKPKGSTLRQSYGYIDHTNPSQSLVSIYDTTPEEQYVTYTGYLMQAEIEELREILMNPFVYIRENGVTYSIEILGTQEMELSNSDAYNYQLKINWKYQVI